MAKSIKYTALAAMLLGTASAYAGVFREAPVQRGADDPFALMPRNERTWKFNRTDKAGKPVLSTKALDLIPETDFSAPYSSIMETSGTLLGPDGTEWFYTLDPKGEILVQNPYFTDIKYTSVTIKVYNSALELVGVAEGDIPYPDGAKRCRDMEVGPHITKKFFNSDANYEVMLNCNFNPIIGAGAKQTTIVFSLLPEGSGKQQPVQTIKGYYTDAQNLGTEADENFVMTFFDSSTWDTDDDYYNKQFFNTYRSEGSGETGAQLLKETVLETGKTAQMGNEMLPCFFKAVGNTIYMVEVSLEKSYFAHPDDYFDDTLSPDNHYLIDLYKGTISGGFTHVKKTSIPMEAPAAGFNFRSYSLGGFSGTNDITFDFNSSSELPNYIISITDEDLEENTQSFYRVYDTDANIVKSFGEGSDGFIRMSDIAGFPSLYAFLGYGQNGDYGLVMLEYPQMNETAVLPIMFEADGDVYNLSANMDRIAHPTEGYVYIISGANGSLEDGKIVHRLVYFTRQGEIDHIDALRFSADVAKVGVYVDAEVLDPYLFHTNKTFDYVCWIERRLDPNTPRTVKELSVVSNEGEVYAKYTMPTDAAYNYAFCVNVKTNPKLVIAYRTLNPEISHQQIIDMPINNFEGEGTADSPYMLYTFGDFDQIRNHPAAHFAFGDNIDLEHRSVKTMADPFTGSIDGRGKKIENLSISGTGNQLALFSAIGATDASRAVVKNFTIDKPELTAAASNSLGNAILATKVENADIESVHIVSPKISGESAAGFGPVAYLLADNAAIKGCSVSGADIELPEASNVGGLVSNIGNATVLASGFEGKINAHSNVGGTAASAVEGESNSAITDCHVLADISATNNIGGIIANAGNSSITRCLVEGTISSTEGSLNIGGIAGFIPSAAENIKVVDKCIVALNAIKFDASTSTTSVHRIAGSASDAQLGNNYAAANLAAIDATEGLATEGTDFEFALADKDWYTGHGFTFDGASHTSPWVLTASTPALHFESAVPVRLAFGNTKIAGKPATTATVLLIAQNIDLGDLTMDIADEAIATYADMQQQGVNYLVTLNLVAEGSTTMTVKASGLEATVNISVDPETGIAETVATGSSLYFTGTAVIADAHIQLFTVAGTLVAAADGSIDTTTLTPGIYIARTPTATLKITVK